jgi:hypothetical protein
MASAASRCGFICASQSETIGRRHGRLEMSARMMRIVDNSIMRYCLSRASFLLVFAETKAIGRASALRAALYRVSHGFKTCMNLVAVCTRVGLDSIVQGCI